MLGALLRPVRSGVRRWLSQGSGRGAGLPPLDGEVLAKAKALMDEPGADKANPEITRQMMELLDAVEGGGGGLTGAILRSDGMKKALEQAGGTERLRSMLADPRVQHMAQGLAKDPALRSKMSAAISDLVRGAAPEKK